MTGLRLLKLCTSHYKGHYCWMYIDHKHPTHESEPVYGKTFRWNNDMADKGE